MKEKKAIGRPTKFTEEIKTEICEAISTSSQGLQRLCDQNNHWPAFKNIYLLMLRDDSFRQKYLRAKELQIESNIDVLQTMIDTDHYQDLDSNSKIDSGVFRAKIEAIKWLSARLQPKRYSDATQQASNIVHQETMLHRAKLDEQNKKDC